MRRSWVVWAALEVVLILALGAVMSWKAGAQTAGLQLVPPDLVPPSGTFFSLQNTNFVPLPWDPYPDLDVYASSNAPGWYWVDDSSIDYGSLGQQREIANRLRQNGLAFDLDDDPPSPPGGWDGPSGDDPGVPVGAQYSYPSNSLWLEMVGVTNDAANLILHGTQPGEVYELMSRLTLTNATWAVEQAVHAATNQDWTPITVGIEDRTNALWFWARDWTGVDSNSNGIPDWWEWENFGDLNQTASGDYDGDGVNNGMEYTNGTDPNTISFFITPANQYSSNALTLLQVGIIAGVPSSMAVLVDNTNYASATWIPYASNLVANLGSVQGWHKVYVGLRGRRETSDQTWHGTQVKLLSVPPNLSITNPSSFSANQPVIQIQGFSSEQLAMISYDLTNALGLLTNQIVQVVDQFYDTNQNAYSTNYFQCFDVPLTNGANMVTLRATDFAGNTAVTNFTLMVDYSTRTNAPVITPGWPMDGTRIGASTFICCGQVSDPAAQVAVCVVDTNGVTNMFSGRVGRAGDFWVENVPLLQATNIISITATDATGNSSTTNITVFQSDVTLTVDWVSPTDGTAGGSVSDPDCSVWVNGVQAVNYGDGTWGASGLGLTLDVRAVQARAIPSSDNGGAGSPGGQAPFGANESNPQSAQATDAEGEVVWPEGTSYEKAVRSTYFLDIYAYGAYGEYMEDWVTDWQESGGMESDRVTDSPVQLFSGPYDDEYTWQAGRYPVFGEGTEVYTGPLGNFTQGAGAPAEPDITLQGWNTGYLEQSLTQPSAFTYSSDHDQVVFLSGGMPGERGVALYGINGGAKRWVPTNTAFSDQVFEYEDVPPENVWVGSLGNFDTNSFMLVAVEKNTVVDISPVVQGGGYATVSVLPTPYHVVTQTYSTVPANRSRTTLGVGEQVTISLQPNLGPPNDALLRWTTTAGSLSAAVGNQTIFYAPSNAASVVVTMYYKLVAYPITFKVVEPTGVDHADLSYAITYGNGLAVAGMHLRPVIGPTNVSFYNVQCWEVGQDATQVWGFFTNFNAATISHINHGAGEWFGLNYDNSWKEPWDNAESGSYSSWYAGGYTWIIPGLWKVGTGPANDLATPWTQSFSLDNSGVMTVNKFGHSVSRTTQGVYSGH